MRRRQRTEKWKGRKKKERGGRKEGGRGEEEKVEVGEERGRGNYSVGGD